MQLALGRAPGLTAASLRRALALLSGAGHPARGLDPLYRQPRATLEALGLGAAASAALAAPDPARLAADRRWIECHGVRLIDVTSPLYPALLSQIDAAPVLLYVRGDAGLLCAPQLAIVGARNPSLPGARTARAFAAALAAAGLTITSGLALGIDAAAHTGALDGGGATVAVLGHGADRIYPRQHAALAQRIHARGALVSEYPPGTPPRGRHFPARNRLISGLCLGTLVVEAAAHSGSLVTARLAAAHGRAVFAVPGSIHYPLSRGCHALIRDGACLVECPADVLAALKITAPKQALAVPIDRSVAAADGGVALDKDYKILLDALGFEPASPDVLVERTGLPSQSVASMLLFLELEDVVGLQSGGRYVRL